MTLTCPYCKRKFYKGKTNEFGRLSKHIWREHRDKQKAKIRKGQRDRKKQLTSELEYTDDMLIQSLMKAGIPLYAPQGQQIPYSQQPTQHQDLTGAILTGIKIGQAIAAGVKTVQTVKKITSKKRSKK